MSRIFVPLVAALVLAGAVADAEADIFHLKSGGKIEGEIIEQDGDSYTIRTKLGRQTLAKADVVKIDEKPFSGGKKAGNKDEYKKRLAKIDARDPDAYYELGMWAKNAGLRSEATRSFRKATQLDPNHEKAHKALGNVLFDGIWMSPGQKKRLEAERGEQKFREQGLVQYKGEWVKKEDIEYLEKGWVKHDDGSGNVSWVSPDVKKKLDQGLVEVDGRWLDGEEAENLAKGLFKVNGKYVPKEEANEHHSSWDNAWELDSEHYMLVTDKDYDYAIDVLQKAEKTYAKLATFFGEEPELYGDKLYIYMFKGTDEYNQFASDNTGAEEGFRQSVFGGFYSANHPDTPAAINSEFDERNNFDWTDYHLYHSLALQYIAEVQPNITSAWLRESIVSYFQRFAFYEWPSLREAFGQQVVGNRFIPLDDFMEFTSLSDDPSVGFYVGGDRPRQVAEGGLLILYLTAAGPVEYHEQFAEFLERMKKSSLDTETFRKVFKVKKLEQDFKAWVDGLK